ncbi:MAG: protein kinase [Myxococcota bacterium]
MNDLKSNPGRKERRPLPSHIPHTVAKRFRVLSLLGSGAVGDVTEAYDLSQRRLVALKILRRDKIRSNNTLDRFFREAEMLGRLDHPGVVQVYASGTDEQGTHYLAMELIDGRSLQEEMQLRGRMPARMAARLIMEVCEVLTVAHQLNVVHRDLKPGNLLLPAGWTEGQATVKIVDFGVAKVFGNAREFKQLTMTGHPVGTPQYMAPEQVAGEEVDGRTDLYALGCILYYTLTGYPPIDGPNPFAVYVAQVERTPVRIEQLVGEPYVTRPFADLIHHLLAKSPDERPPHAAATEAELRRLFHTLPQTANPEPIPSPDSYALEHNIKRTLQPGAVRYQPADSSPRSSPAYPVPQTPVRGNVTPASHDALASAAALAKVPTPESSGSARMPAVEASASVHVSEPTPPAQSPPPTAEPPMASSSPSGPHSGPSEGLDAIPATRSGPTQAPNLQPASATDGYAASSGYHSARTGASGSSRLKGLALGALLGLLILILLAGGLLGVAHLMGISPIQLLRGADKRSSDMMKAPGGDVPLEHDSHATSPSDMHKPEQGERSERGDDSAVAKTATPTSKTAADDPDDNTSDAGSADPTTEAPQHNGPVENVGDTAVVPESNGMLKGTVTLSTTPAEAEVFRGHQKLGTAPMTVDVEVSDSRPAVFWVRADKHRVQQVVLRPEDLTSGEKRIAVVLEKLRQPRRTPCSIEVNSRPEGAEVSEQGQFLGLTPLVVQRPISDRLHRFILTTGEHPERAILVAALHTRQLVNVDLITGADPIVVPLLKSSRGKRPQ